jgi:hypothetical protein
MSERLPNRCFNCGVSEPWRIGVGVIGRLGSDLRVNSPVTECRNCGFHLMTDEQINLADSQLLVLELHQDLCQEK